MLSSIRGVRLKQSTDFVYLEGKISDSADLSADIVKRIGLATGVGRSLAAIWKSKVIPNTAVFGPTNFIGTTTTIASTARMKISLDEDFYGGRTGPLEKFYLFIFC